MRIIFWMWIGWRIGLLLGGAAVTVCIYLCRALWVLLGLVTEGVRWCVRRLRAGRE